MKNNKTPTKFQTLLYRLICVPKCASCGTRLSPFVDENEFNHGIPCLCDECMKKLQAACVQMCHTCSKVASACTCMPLKKTFTQPTIPSLFFYHPDASRAESKVIYSLKHKDSRDLFDFLTAELYPKLDDLLSELEIDAKECIFTYVPRTRKAIVNNGFDQGQRLCKRMASRAGAVSHPLLSREGGKEQKKLAHKQRKKNVGNAIYPNTSMRGFARRYRKKKLAEILSGKTVIIIEDIITTGATVQRAIKCLKDSGAKTVIVCAVARSEIATDKTGKKDK